MEKYDRPCNRDSGIESQILSRTPMVRLIFFKQEFFRKSHIEITVGRQCTAIQTCFQCSPTRRIREHQR